MSQLGTLEELPVAYRESLVANNTAPLWPSMRDILPHGIPSRRATPVVWRYKAIRDDLIKAGELTPIEKAERRVLVLSNPGLGVNSMLATPSIFIGLQMILPRETAPTHKHSPSAIRFVIEGEGGYTVVNGEKCPMHKGDLILTPSGMWHEHGHEGSKPVIWLDALDFPIVNAIEASYAVEGAPQVVRNAPDSSQTRFRRSGLVPYNSLTAAHSPYPLLRFPWKDVRESLQALASGVDDRDVVQLAYVNPETGKECLPILGFSAIMLRPGETVNFPRRSCSMVLHAIEGEGQIEVDGKTMDWSESDTIGIPTHARVNLSNRSSKAPAFLFQVDDAPMQRKLGFYEVFPA